jgi:hypothetical protein
MKANVCADKSMARSAALVTIDGCNDGTVPSLGDNCSGVPPLSEMLFDVSESDAKRIIILKMKKKLFFFS